MDSAWARGFCFGGGLTWELLNAGEARVAAAIPFYGPLPESPDFSRAEAAFFNDTGPRYNAAAAAEAYRAVLGWFARYL